MKYFYQISTSSCYGIDPHTSLDADFYINTIRKHLNENPKYYQEMIKNIFLDNKHKLTIVVKPVDGFIDRNNNKIKEDLAQQKSKLNQGQIDQIIKNYNLLKENQEKPQPIELLPSIKKSDIEVIGQYDHITKTEDNVSVLALPLNGMTYVDFILKIDFAHPLFKYLPLLTNVISKVGAGEMDEEQLELFTKLHCNELSFTISEKADLDNYENGCAQIKVSTYCLDRNIEPTIKIFNSVFFEPHLINPDRVKTLLKMQLNELNNRFQYRGDHLLSQILRSGLTDPCAISNVIKGSDNLHFLNELIEKDDWNDVCQKLDTVYKEVFLRAKARCFIHTKDSNSTFIGSIKEIVNKFNTSNDSSKLVPAPPVDKSLFENYKKVFVETESSTNFTAIACETVSYKNESNALFLVLSKIMENEFLHNLVRVEIGAYGVWAIQYVELGVFEIRSFRDPNPSKCLEAFQKALDFCASEEKITDEMVDRAIMKVFSDFDYPEEPSTKGNLEFNGKSKEIIQKRRDIAYNATKKQIVDLAKSLKEKEWRYGIFANPKTSNPPEGYTIVKLTV